MAELLEAVTPVINDDMNLNLCAAFTKDEVQTACKQIHPSKVPGSDGMPGMFYQKFWSILGTDVITFCLECLNGNRSLDEVNKTFIVLIPKVKKPETLTQFHPISLCNVLYKIITKTIVNIWKHFLPACISKNQNAFVPGRLILDNVIIAHEFLHSFTNKQDGKASSFALKLDMTKAYDTVEWIFIEAMMLKMGFKEEWVKLILKCISSLSYSVVINGAITDEFKAEEGL